VGSEDALSAARASQRRNILAARTAHVGQEPSLTKGGFRVGYSPMNPIAASSCEHVAQLAALLEDLASHWIGLYEHRYDASVFGSFQVTLGRPHERVRFTWEGRDATLGVEFQRLKSQQDKAAWVHDAYISFPNHADVYAEIGSESCRMLTV
jgi:hypothetical protein